MSTSTPAAPVPTNDEWAQAKVETLWRKAALDLSQQSLLQSATFLALSRFVR